MGENCLNCGHAQWLVTKHNPPRIKPDSVGRCQCPVELFEVKVPAAVIRGYGWRAPKRGQNIFSAHPYADCPLWTAVTEKST